MKKSAEQTIEGRLAAQTLNISTVSAELGQQPVFQRTPQRLGSFVTLHENKSVASFRDCSGRFRVEISRSVISPRHRASTATGRSSPTESGLA